MPRGSRGVGGGGGSTGGGGPSSVVFFWEVQGAQVPEAQPHALHVEAVDFSLLALQQVFDAVGSLLLKGTQLLFDLWDARRQRLHHSQI